MPKCKYCGAQISKLDKDVCPMCGAKKPLEGILDETVDYTHVMDAMDDDGKEVNYKSRILAGILAILFGVFGVHNFYVGKYKLALINILETVVFVGIGGTMLYFWTGLGVWSYLIWYFFELAIFIWIGVTYFVRHDLKDGRGEIMR